MPQTVNGGKIQFGVGFKTDTSGLKQLEQSLTKLQNVKMGDLKNGGTLKDLKEIQETAQKVQEALKNAFNVNLNSLNIDKFNQELKKSDLNIDKIYTDFSKAGIQGQKAFSQMTNQILNTNLKLKQTKSIIDSLGQTLINSIKWNVASAAINAVTGSIQQAFGYVKNLDSSLTNIRIVTGDSREQMAKFAVEANNAAAALGKTTRDYTDAALSFYQQGLNDEEVRVRTEASLKAQNITQGQASVDELTAVWNGYQVSVADTQKYVDKLAAVADSSASDMSQLATAMSKVAATANVMGVDIDQLTAQIATIVATTRQAPQTVGNALKTIYARINDIKAGTDEAEVSLGNYSGKMAALGFNVLDSNGNLRQTGQVMEEIGERWETLTNEQQVYLAQTMAGQRQYNQLISLFDNWTQYSEMLNVSLESEGTLNEKNARYMESLAAHMEQFTAARQNLMDSMLNTDSMKSFVDVGTTIVNLLAKFVDSIGGGGAALLSLGSIATTVFSKQIGEQINNVVVNFQNLKYNAEAVQKQMQMVQMFGQSQGYKREVINEMVDAQSKISKYNNIISNEQRQQYNILVSNLGKAQQQVLELNAQKEQVGKIVKSWDSLSKHVKNFSDITQVSSQSAKKINDEYTKVKNTFNSIIKYTKQIKVGKMIDTDAQINVNQLLTSIQKSGIVSKTVVKELRDQITHLGAQARNGIQPTVQEVTKLQNLLSNFQSLGNTKLDLIGNILGNGAELTQTYIAQLELAKQETESFRDKLAQLAQSVNITKMVGGIGQLTSSLLQLKNIGNIWTDESLSGGEKFLRTISNLAFSLPMLATGLTSVSTALGFQSTILDVLKAKMIARQALQTKQIATLAFKNTVEEAYNKLKAGQITVEEYNNSIKTAGIVLTQAQTTATVKQKAAQDALNTSILMNPYFLGGAAIIATIAAIAAIVDAMTISVKQANKNLEQFNQKQEQFNNSNKQKSQDIQTLDKAAKEYEYLSEKAGLYDSQINNLTDNEKQRYNEIKNLIAQNIPEAVAYWDAEGNAILNTNANLKTYIETLKEKQKQQLQDLYGADSKTRKEHTGSVQTLFNEDRKQQSSNEKIIDDNQQYVSSHVTTSLQAMQNLIKATDEESQVAKQAISTIQSLKEQAIETGHVNVDTLLNLSQTLQPSKFFNNAISERVFQEHLSSINNYSTSIADALTEAEDDTQKRMQHFKGFDTTFIVNAFKADNYDLYTELENLGTENGIQNIDAYISNYAKGLNQYDFKNAKEGVEQAAIKAVGDFSTALKQVFQDQPTLQEDINKFFFDSQNNPIDFSTLNVDEYNQQLANFINNIIQNNETLKNISSTNPELAQNLIQSLFDIKGVKIDSNGIASQIENQYTTLREDIVTKLLAKGYSKQEIELFKPSIGDLENQDAIIARIGQEVGNLADDWDNATRAQNNYTALSEGTSALSLLEKRSKGQSLSKEEQETLQSGLNSLSSTYTELADKVAILNNEQLQGTREYNRALQDVKNSLIENLSTAWKSGEMEKPEAIQYAKQLVTNMENLQAAYIDGTLRSKDYNDSLLKIASNYESCLPAVNRFKQAIEGNSQALYREAGMQLEVAVRSAEVGESTGIQAQRIQSLSNHFLQLAASGQQGYEGIKGNAQAAVDAAQRYIKLNDAIENLYGNLDEYKNLLTEARQNGLDDIYANEELYNSFVTLKDGVADMLDTSSDLLGDDWIVDQAENITQAINGNEDALHALEDAAREEIFSNLNIDTSGFDENIDEIWNKIDELPDGVDMSMDADIAPFLQSMVTAMQQAGMTQTEIEQAFSGMNINLDLAPYEAGLNAVLDEAAQAGAMFSDAFAGNAGVSVNVKNQKDNQSDEITNQQFDEEVIGAPVTSNDWVLSDSGDGLSPTLVHQRVTAFSKRVTAVPVTSTATKQTTATALEVVGATKKSGGKISNRNTTTGRANRPTTGKGGGGGRKGGGGGGKSSSPKQPKTEKPKKVKTDPYHKVNRQLEDQQRKLKKLNDLEEDLIPRDRLAVLEKESKQYDKQIKLLKEKEGIANSELARLKTSLTGQQASNVKVQFQANGQIANYNEVLKSAYDKYNDWVTNVYNKMTAEQQQAAAAQKQRREQALKQLEDNLQEYEKTLDLIDNIEDALQAANKAQAALFLTALKYRMQIREAAGDLQRQFQDFSDKVINDLADDDYLGQVQSKFDKIMSYVNSKELEERKKQIDILRQELDNINKGIESKYSAAEVQSMLDDLLRQQMSDLQEIKDLQKEIQQQFIDALDNAKDKQDQVMDQYGRINDQIQRGIDLTNRLYGDKAYAMLDKYYEKQNANNLRELQTLKQQENYWRAIMNSQQTGSQAWKAAREHLESVVDAFGDKLEQALDNLATWWENQVDLLVDNLNNKLTGGMGTEYLDFEWDQMSRIDDDFLDAVNRSFSTNEIRDMYQEGLDALADSPAAQAKLNKLMKQQMKILEEKEDLTQYDIDRAKALYDIEMKRFELEEMRNSKTTMRLRRDSQGNYTYQYVEDEEKVSDLQKALSEAENNLYNMDKQHYKETLQNMYDVYKEYQEKRTAVNDQLIKAEQELRDAETQEAKAAAQKKIDALQKYAKEIDDTYTKLFEMYQKDAEWNKGYVGRSAAAVLGLQGLTDDDRQKLVDTLVPYATSSIAALQEAIAGQGGFMEAVVKPLTAGLEQAGQKLLDGIAEAKSMYDENAEVREAENEFFLQFDVEQMNKAAEQVSAVSNTLKAIDEWLKATFTQEFIDNIVNGVNQVQESNVMKDEDSEEMGLGAQGNTKLTPLQTDTSSFNGASAILPMSVTNAEDDTARVDYWKTLLDNQELGTDAYAAALANYEGALQTAAINKLVSSLADYYQDPQRYLSQAVTINADFPNVESWQEIVEAIKNLTLTASQQSSSTIRTAG